MSQKKRTVARAGGNCATVQPTNDTDAFARRGQLYLTTLSTFVQDPYGGAS